MKKSLVIRVSSPLRRFSPLPRPDRKPVPSSFPSISRSLRAFPLLMQAPEGATAADDFGDVLVKKGVNFQIEVSSNAKDIESLKKEIKANTLNKLKSFLVDTPDALLYESTVMGKSEFHFAANVKAGGTT